MPATRKPASKPAESAAASAVDATAKIAAATEAAKAVPVPETPTVLSGVVDKAGTNGKAAPKPKPKTPAKTPKPDAEAKPAPAPKPAKVSAPWFDTANRPATANEIARYEWTCKTAGIKPADFPIELFLLGARNQKYFQEAHR